LSLISQEILDEWALLRLAYRYARAVDRNEPEAFAALFAPDATLDAGVMAWTGHAELRTLPGNVDALYESTFHTVLQQAVTIVDDTATGETVGIAYHLNRPVDGLSVRIDWAIRYQDSFVRANDDWLFTRRCLAVDWTRQVAL
jgi:hypothetical protein